MLNDQGILYRYNNDETGRVQADGTCWLGGTTWNDAFAVRVSVSNWSTTEGDIERSAVAIVRCARAARAQWADASAPERMPS
jgi:hypothetical protein